MLLLLVARVVLLQVELSLIESLLLVGLEGDVHVHGVVVLLAMLEHFRKLLN